MAIIKDSDISILKKEAESVDYGTVKLEFKHGECVAVSHEGRVFTDKGQELFQERKNNRRTV